MLGALLQAADKAMARSFAFFQFTGPIPSWRMKPIRPTGMISSFRPPISAICCTGRAASMRKCTNAPNCFSEAKANPNVAVLKLRFSVGLFIWMVSYYPTSRMPGRWNR